MEGFSPGRLIRVFIDERDRRGVQPLYTAIVEYLRSKGIAGATVFRGIEGYGSHHEIHVAKPFSWVPNVPVLVEVVDEAAKIETILPGLRDLVGEGLLTLENVEYLQIVRE